MEVVGSEGCKIKTRIMNVLDGLFILLPLSWFVFLYAYVVRSRLVLGYWPSPYNPDPKSLIALEYHYNAVWIVGLMAFKSIPVYLGFAILSKWLRPDARIGTRMIIFTLIWVLTFVWFVVDPGRFIEWYFD